MKILVVLALLLPITAAAQTQADYERAMEKFQRFYNAGQADSIQAMFPSPSSKSLWGKEDVAEILTEYGTLQSFTFLGIDEKDPERVHVFQTYFSKAGAKAMSLTLYKDLQLGTFRFPTTSKGIRELLKKKKRSR